MPEEIDLIKSIEKTIRKVHLQSLDISFNEILDMKENNELDISPDYQRLFRWTEGQRSRFIESLLLEMPVPPIYVVEEEEGNYLLIDGLQRISSYLHFRGKLEAKHLDPPVNIGAYLKLSDCDIISELNGKTYNDLPTALKIRLKRSFVRVEVVRKGSDPKFKYHMFKRLNTGGILLTPQQLRNCTIRLLDSRFNDFIINLAEKNEAYKNSTTNLSSEQILGSFNHELILRFFALKNWKDKFVHDVADFLTEFMEGVTLKEIDFDYDQNKNDFEKTFSILYKAFDSKAFGLANKTRNGITNSIGVYQFEAFTIGIQKHLGKIDSSDNDQIQKINENMKKIKLSEEFIALTTGGGKNSKGSLSRRIKYVEENIL